MRKDFANAAKLYIQWHRAGVRDNEARARKFAKAGVPEAWFQSQADWHRKCLDERLRARPKLPSKVT